MFYYRRLDKLLCSVRGDLPYQRLDRAPGGEEKAVFLFEREPSTCRASFAAGDPRQLLAREEDARFLDPSRMEGGETTDPFLLRMIERRGLRAVNRLHPRLEELIRQSPKTGKKRVNILAIGDVGSTLLIGLRLLGGDVISSIGVCDLSQAASARWEFEANQISYPWDYDALPEVEVISPGNLFDCDLLVFVASKGIPPVGSRVKDVRMAQFEANAAIAGKYARLAREKRFGGLFAVVSDPVDPLAKTVYLESNRGAAGEFDGLGLFPEQVQGYGLGVMNARAAYFAKRDARFERFLTEGRAFGPHGGDLVVANSVEHYDDALSRELTDLAVTANLRMRELGFKPYVAPALSSGAISILLTLRGEWHYGSVFLGGVYLGVKNRYLPAGIETECLSMPDPLFGRIERAAKNLAAIC